MTASSTFPAALEIEPSVCPPLPFSAHSSHSSQIVPTFDELARMRDEDIEVLTGSALIARDAYASLNVSRLLAQFDELAATLIPLGLAKEGAQAAATEISHYLYDVCGFRGNEADYYDPKNSLLPDVLTRKLGIPITLALVYIEVAKRCGVSAVGVNFPGHYLVRVDSRNGESVFVDPFYNGRILDEAALLKLLRHSGAPDQELKPEHLAPASPRQTLVRMLINLKWIYATRGDNARALLALDRIVSLSPDTPAALRERGLMAAKLGALETARADLTRLLEIQPNAADANSIRARLKDLSATVRTLN